MWQTLIWFKVFGILVFLHVIVLRIVVLCGCASIFPTNVLCIGVFHLGIGMFLNKIHYGPTICFFVGLFLLFELTVLFVVLVLFMQIFVMIVLFMLMFVVLTLVFTYWCFSHWSSTKFSSLWFSYCSSFLWWSLWPNLDVCLYHSSLVYLFLHGDLIIHHVHVGFIIHFLLNDDFLYKFLGLQLMDGTMEGEISIGHQR